MHLSMKASCYKSFWGGRRFPLPDPVFDGSGVPFVLFGDEEPDKLRVTHPRLIVHVVGVGVVAELGRRQSVVVRRAAGDGPREYPIDHLGGQSCRKSKKKREKDK